MKMAIFALLIALTQQPGNDSLMIKDQTKTIGTISKEDLAQLTEEMYIMDDEKINQLSTRIDNLMYKPPVNAQVSKSGGIIQEKKGYRLHREKFRELLYSYFYWKGPMTVQAPKMDLYPRVDSDLLNSIRSARIGSYVTFFNKRNVQRSTNISLAAEAINNTVVFPGETFSFNGVVGNRTSAKGYMKAPIIIKGELAEGIGGGICQVSSTLFNATDNAGLKTIERFSHSRNVPYVPKGRDATVSWYGPDFKFTNKYSEPVLIMAAVYSSSVTVTIYSTKEVLYEKSAERNK
ncbi:VanW family protein [Metabacillus indicus]|uniref:VanW family protein n=1 Tax=Metabacillus indicus TaxID=246786 RepID=UPI003CEF8396